MNNMMTKLTVGILSLLLTSLVFVIFVARPEAARLPAEEINFNARAIENGALIFEANCIGCHGIQGKGIPGVAPALNDAQFFTTRLTEVGYVGSLRSYIEGTVNAGRPVGSGQYSAKMATWGKAYGGPLRPDQISDVASYILNWEATALGTGTALTQTVTTGPTIDETLPPVELGKAVYAANGCAGCHGDPSIGSAGVVGPTMTGIASRAGNEVSGTSAADYIRQSILQPNAHIVAQCPTGACANPSVMPATFSTTIPPKQLDGLVEYLLTLE
ncbi:MAG: c-type cytochrome [Caldilineales bacterium]